MPFLVRRPTSPHRRRREITDYRRDHDLSQKEAAEKLRISQAHLNFLERGLRDPSPTLAKRMEKVMGLDAARLLRLTGKRAS